MKRTLFAAIAMCALVGLVRADDLEDSYGKLKDSVAKKDPDAVKADAAATFKLAQAAVSAPKPADASEADWKQNQDRGKEIIEYAENVLAYTATQVEGQKTIELVDALRAENPKSKYLDVCTSAYLAALGKTGNAAKQLEGMTKIAEGRPDNEVALAALAEGLANKSPDRALGYANKLVAVLKTKGKPEGLSEADWEKTKTAGLTTGYYISGLIYGGQERLDRLR